MIDLGTTTVVVAFDGVDLHEHGFAKPSKRRGRRTWCSSPTARGGAATLVEEMAAALRGEGWRRRW